MSKTLQTDFTDLKKADFTTLTKFSRQKLEKSILKLLKKVVKLYNFSRRLFSQKCGHVEHCF